MGEGDETGRKKAWTNEGKKKNESINNISLDNQQHLKYMYRYLSICLTNCSSEPNLDYSSNWLGLPFGWLALSSIWDTFSETVIFIGAHNILNIKYTVLYWILNIKRHFYYNNSYIEYKNIYNIENNKRLIEYKNKYWI